MFRSALKGLALPLKAEKLPLTLNLKRQSGIARQPLNQRIAHRWRGRVNAARGLLARYILREA